MPPFRFTTDVPTVNEMCAEVDAVLLCSGVELMSGAMSFSANHDPKWNGESLTKTPQRLAYELDMAAEFPCLVGGPLGKAEGEMMV